MPCFVIVSSTQRGKAVNAILCDAGPSGYPDRKTDTPVTATVAAEDSLTIDNETQPRSIISCTGVNGVVTYLINGSTSSLRNRERRAKLAKALAMLNQIRDVLMPLVTTSEEESDGLVAEGLGQIYNWMAEERND
jgi:hypothetical protein